MIVDLEINETKVQDAVRRISKHFSLPMGISFDGHKSADLKVSGTISNDKLKASLNRLLNPAGLTVIVKYEIVLVVPIDK